MPFFKPESIFVHYVCKFLNRLSNIQRYDVLRDYPYI